MNKKGIAMMLAGVMVLGMTGCGGGNDKSGAGTENAESGTDKSAEAGTDTGSEGEDDRQVITLARQNDGDGAVEATIEAFEKSQDKYKVKWIEVPNTANQVRDMYNTAFSAGSSEYDVISMDTVWTGDMAGAGYLAQLDSYIMDSGHNLSEYNAGSVQAGTYDGKTYALPLYPDLGVMFYRKDIVSDEDAKKLESADYTWADLIGMAEKYQEESKTKYGLVFQAAQQETLVCNLNEWTANFSEVQDGLEQMKNAVDSKATPDDILVYEESDAANNFVSGEAVFCRNWPYVWGTLNEETAVSKDQVGVAPLPDGGCIGGWLLGINANSKNKEGAWELLNFFTSMEGQKVFCTVGSHCPGFNAVMEDQEVLDANELLNSEAFQKALTTTIARPISDKYTEVSDGIQIAAHKYLAGEEELENTAERINNLLQ
jgi:multiple sugar transport system substrate-binding protein